MKYIYRGFLLLMAVLIATSLLPLMIPTGPVPDLLLIIVITYSLLRGSNTGFLIGFSAGFLQDIFGPGTNLLAKPIVGILAGRFDGKIYKGNFIIPPVIIFIFSFLNGILTFFINEEYLFYLSFTWSINYIILPSAVVDGLVGGCLYPLFYLAECKWFGLSADS